MKMLTCIYRGFQLILLGFLTILLLSCVSNNLALNFSSSHQLNADTAWAALPVEVKVFELTSPELFNSASFNELWKQGPETLGDSLVSQTSYTILPASQQSFSFEGDSKTRYVGFVAIFLNHQQGPWRAIEPVPSFYFFHPHFNVNLKGDSIYVESAVF